MPSAKPISDAAEMPEHLVRYLRRQIRRLDRTLPKLAKHAKPKAVHDARVAARRVGAMLKLLRPLLGKKHLAPLNKAAKRIRKALGPVRDIDVMIESIKAREELPRPERMRLAKALKVERDAAAKAARRRLRKCDVHFEKSLRKQIASAAPAILTALRESLHAQLDALAEAAGDAAGEKTGLHPTRIATKRLRYTVEIAMECTVPIPAAAVTQLEAFQESLGTWHDAAVLAQAVLKHTADDEEIESRPQGGAQRVRLAQAIATDAMRAANRFAQAWQKGGVSLDRALRKAMPAHRISTAEW